MSVPPLLVGFPFWSQPLWLIFAVVAATLMVGHELGIQFRRRTRGAMPDAAGDDGGQIHLTASISLLALLIGFSFGMALDHYNKRRILVSEEANAISTTYRRLLAVDEPASTILRRAFVPYVEAREAFSRVDSEGELLRAAARADRLQRQFWSTLIRTAGARDLAARPALDAASDMFNLAHARRAAAEADFPRVILFGLLLYATVTAVFMGYLRIGPRRYLVASAIQSMLLSLAICLIVDLDRPRSGLVTVNQAPIYRAAASIRQAQTEALPGSRRTPSRQPAASDVD